jgi:nucleotide-binding universal stress UspA family protein
MKTILAPIDFSKVSEPVVKEAVALARSLDGRVVLLTVVQPPVVMTESAGMLDIAKLIDADEQNARRQLGEIAGRIKTDFINVTSLQTTGSPVTHIIEQADKCGADYIVMGSHGHTAFYDLLVGNTTHGVLMRAKCPVVIVPATKQAPKPRKEKKRVSVA